MELIVPKNLKAVFLSPSLLKFISLIPWQFAEEFKNTWWEGREFTRWVFLPLNHSKLKKCHQTLKMKSSTSPPCQLILVKQRTNKQSGHSAAEKVKGCYRSGRVLNYALSWMSSCWMVSGEPGKLLVDLSEWGSWAASSFRSNEVFEMIALPNLLHITETYW